MTVTPFVDDVSVNQPGMCRICRKRRSVGGRCTGLCDPCAAMTMLEAGLEPLVPYPGVDIAWPSRCTSCGHDVSPRLASVTSGRSGCRFCSSSAGAAWRRISDARAEEILRQAGLEPLTPYPGSGKRPWSCRCLRCGAETTPRLSNVINGHGGCQPCAWRLAGEALRRDGKEAQTIMRSAGLEPLEPYTSMNTPWRSLCLRCGRETSPRLASVERGHGGCRPCFARSGWYDITKPGVLYLVGLADGHLAKYGISNRPAKRLQQHAWQGFPQTLQLAAFDDGQIPLAAERRIVKTMRARGIRPAARREDMPFGGYTETFFTREVPDFDLAAFL